ncbi:MAG: Uma2 family endonuclease [Saprospiraceae bacterium]
MTQSVDKHIIQEILAHPNAPSLVKKVNAILADEQNRRLEFYEDITDSKKIEFINGEIIEHSPVIKAHNDVYLLLVNLIGVFVSKNKLGYVGGQKIMIGLERNDYEPDICFFNQKKAKYFKKGQNLFPTPDFVVEILSRSTEDNDRGIKFTDYEAHGVAEYLLIDPKKEIVEFYRLNIHKKYELVLKSTEGTLFSQTIKGFAINIKAIFDEDENINTLNRILSA